MILDDYDLTLDILQADFKRPGVISRSLRYVMSFLVISSITYYVIKIRFFPDRFDINNVIIALLVGIILVLIGIFDGHVWRYIGFKIASSTYLIYLDQWQTRFRRLFSKIYFSLEDKDAFVYLEGKAKDKDLTNFGVMIRLILKISIPLLSFFILGISLVSLPLMEYLQSHYSENQFLVDYEFEIVTVGTLFLSVSLMALYIPAWLILEDSNMRTWRKVNRHISIPLASIRNKIDSIVGISALGTGWVLFQSLKEGSGFLPDQDLFFQRDGNAFFEVLDYFLWLVYILIISWPLIIPASVTYFQNHSRTVNKFRAEALSNGIQIGVSGVRVPTGEELQIVNEYYKNYGIVNRQNSVDENK